MQDDWTHEHQLAFERVFAVLGDLSLPQVEEFAQALAALTARQGSIIERLALTTQHQADTIQNQAETIERLSEALMSAPAWYC